VSKRDRRDGDRRGERRESQPEDEQQHRTGESEVQEGDSLTALKAILSKVAALLKPLQLTSEESIRLVEQLYSKVLETDLQLAAETDDARKSSVLAAIQYATIRREGDKVIVDYSTAAADDAQVASRPDAPPEAGGGQTTPAQTPPAAAGTAAADAASPAPPVPEPAMATGDLPAPPRSPGAPRRTAPRKVAPAAAAPADPAPPED